MCMLRLVKSLALHHGEVEHPFGNASVWEVGWWGDVVEANDIFGEVLERLRGEPSKMADDDEVDWQLSENDEANEERENDRNVLEPLSGNISF